MGEPNKVRSMRLSNEQIRWIDEVMDVMSPMLPSRTAAVGWGMGVIHTILTNAGILREVEKVFQDASCALFVRRVYDTSSCQGEARKPGPMRMTRPSASRGAGISQFSATSANAGLDPLKRYHAYESHPSLGAVRLLRRIA